MTPFEIFPGEPGRGSVGQPVLLPARLRLWGAGFLSAGPLLRLRAT
jgi:hypothetical protein